VVKGTDLYVENRGPEKQIKLALGNSDSSGGEGDKILQRETAPKEGFLLGGKKDLWQREENRLFLSRLLNELSTGGKDKRELFLGSTNWDRSGLFHQLSGYGKGGRKKFNETSRLKIISNSFQTGKRGLLESENGRFDLFIRRGPGRRGGM